MNPEQQLANKLMPLIQAVADGKNLEMERECFQGNSPNFREWCDVDLDYLLHRFNREGLRFDCIRIKPEPKKEWCRVALLKNRDGTFFTLNADSTDPYEDPEKALIGEFENDFVRWLTDRIEYDLPEEGV